MINKRLLIKNLLAHNDENSFYDKKRRLNLGEKEGKAKFLKHVCALANSNPFNNSYIVVGVEDRDNSIVGVDFFDDSKIQNLVNAYLKNPPNITYENILFPHLPNDQVVGLVIIRANHGRVCSLRKNIWKYYGGAVFFRDGSISMPKDFGIDLTDRNSKIVASIESHSQNTIEYTLDGVFDFMQKNRDYHPTYKVFQEYFVVCWAGKEKVVKDQKYYSRVNIELINEQVKLFYSDLDEISIFFAPDEFKIIEYVYLGLYENYHYYPLEEVKIRFKNNMSYEIESKILFEAPKFPKKTLYHIYNSNSALINKLSKNLTLKPSEEKDIKRLPDTLLLCYLNGIEKAHDKLEGAKVYLKKYPQTYQRLKDNLRILRKVRYN
tara:strand:+ start:524 stop:1657 length:1134 start_codon:yes stop_codon:yes gene_type:complete